MTLDSSNMRKLSYKIMLDRYSEKDINKVLTPGALVIATTDETDPKYPQKEVCTITGAYGGTVFLKHLYSDATYEVNSDKIQFPIETEPDQIWRRVARGCSVNEKDSYSVENGFYDVLKDFEFVPGGRIMAMCGSANQNNLTAFNCFVLPSPKDSRGGAIDTLKDMIEIMSRGGGVGLNISTLRPRYALVRGVNGVSSGAVSWGSGYSVYTGLIEQGGSRRGALLEGLGVWHPDIEEFIDSKRNAGKIENANISVLVTKNFMHAVENNLNWDLIFPDTSFEAYDTEWDGNITKWQEKGYPVQVYKTLPAIDLWNKLMQSAWASGEPGVIWLERYNYLSNTWYFEEIICTNPCGEQGLAGFGVCNLSHVNLAKLELDPGDKLRINSARLKHLIHVAVRFSDNIIDITPYFFEENRRVQTSSRRIGIGTMGFAELLLKLKIRYGSKECLDFAENLYEFIRNEAYRAGIELAKERGSFPAFDRDKFLQGKFIMQLPEDIRDGIYKFGIRNSTYLTQAPTGSGGTMVGTSTGIEPYYAWENKRNSGLGTDIEVVPAYAEWQKYHTKDDILPDYFVTASDVTAEEHVRVMAAIQKYTDSSISKTVNLPSDATVEDVSNAYLLAYKLGCKGITIYRDKSRATQVLEKIEENPTAQQTQLEVIPKVPENTVYTKHKLLIGCGEIDLFIGNYEGRVLDVYSTVSSNGGCQMGIQGMCITISKWLRAGHSIKHFVKSASKAGACGSVQYRRGKGDKIIGKSCFDIIVKTIDHVETELAKNLPTQSVQTQSIPVQIRVDEKVETDKMKCPSCGSKMNLDGGCVTCPDCGYTKC